MSTRISVPSGTYNGGLSVDLWELERAMGEIVGTFATKYMELVEVARKSYPLVDQGIEQADISSLLGIKEKVVADAIENRAQLEIILKAQAEHKG